MALLSREQFLAHFKNHIIVWWRFKANKQWSETNIRHNITLPTAESLNWIKEKRDIFFTPNGDFKRHFWENESKWQKWRSEKTVLDVDWNIYAFIADNDTLIEIRKEIGLIPTIVVRTKNWHHMYFILKNPVSFKEYASRFKDVEDKLIKLVNADPKARDIARILRVPEFKYCADNQWEFGIDVIEYNKEDVYSFDDWEDKINAIYKNTCMDETEKEILKKQYKWKSMWRVLDSIFDKINNTVSAIDVLEELYPNFQARDWGTIYEWDKKTHWYKWNQSKNYINNFSNDDLDERPRWWPWSIAKVKYKSFEQILEYFKERHWIDIDDVRKQLWSVKDIVFEDITIEEKLTPEQIWELIDNPTGKKWRVYKVGNAITGIIVDEVKREIRWYNAENSDIPFVKALILPIGKVMTDKWEKYIIKLQKKDGPEIVDLLPTSGTNTEFRKFLQKYGLMIPDNNKMFIDLYNFVYNNEVSFEMTNKLWMQIIWWKKFIIDRAWTYIDIENKIYVSIEDAGNEQIVISDEEVDIKEYTKQLLEWYWWNIAIPTLLSMLIWTNCFYFRNRWMQLPQVFVFGLSQSWKALKWDTEIPMADWAFKQIRNIKEWDSIIWGNWLPTTVLWKYNPQQQEVYRVKFNAWWYVDCCSDHLREVWNIYRTKKDVMSTKQLIEWWVMKWNRSRYAIDLSPIEYQEKQYNISPYALWVWLWDGSSSCPKIWIRHWDEAIVENIKEDIHFVAKERWCSKYYINWLTPLLKELNLIKNKHIPEWYLVWSRDQRLQLLAWLLDTDWTVWLSWNTNVSFSTSIEQLALNVKQLIISLWWTCNLHKRKTKYTYKWIKKEWKISYTIEFYPDIPVFKLDRQNKKIKFKRDKYRRYIRSITPIEKTDEYYCIQVDSKDKTFMCTRDYIKTHNTTYLKNLFRSFGIKKDMSALSKAFVYEKYAKHYIPTHFSEYRNTQSKQSEQIEWLMRNLFDWTPTEKGRADQTTVKYESNGFYVFDWQTIFTDDAVQTRMIILMANKRYQWDLEKLESLPNIYKYATDLFKGVEDFNSFCELSREKYKKMKTEIKLLRANDRMLTNYSYLYTLLDRLWMPEYSVYLDNAMKEQDWLTAQDDIQMIYQKVMNMKVLYKFDTEIYKRWLVINVVEEWMRYSTTSVEDLKWFIQTINANFLWPNDMSNLSTYIDLDYVYKNRSLHWVLCRVLNWTNLSMEWKTEEEKKTLMWLKEFIKNNYPNHPMRQDINFEVNYSYPNTKTWEYTND